jgi:hypothetical protein
LGYYVRCALYSLITVIKDFMSAVAAWPSSLPRQAPHYSPAIASSLAGLDRKILRTLNRKALENSVIYSEISSGLKDIEKTEFETRYQPRLRGRGLR